jgi:hypothetical protein
MTGSDGSVSSFEPPLTVMGNNNIFESSYDKSEGTVLLLNTKDSNPLAFSMQNIDTD